jgi:hypothetical protein
MEEPPLDVSNRLRHPQAERVLRELVVELKRLQTTEEASQRLEQAERDAAAFAEEEERANRSMAQLLEEEERDKKKAEAAEVKRKGTGKAKAKAKGGGGGVGGGSSSKEAAGPLSASGSGQASCSSQGSGRPCAPPRLGTAVQAALPPEASSSLHQPHSLLVI